MNKLTEMIQLFPRRSGVSVPCEVVPGHSDTVFVEVVINKTTMVNVDGVARPIDAKISIRACRACFNTFVYDSTEISRDLQRNGG